MKKIITISVFILYTLTFKGQVSKTDVITANNIDEPVLFDSVNVTFQVNMQNEVTSGEGVFLNGSFCGWSEAVLMTKSEFGYVYSSILNLKKGERIEYKFVNGAAYDSSSYEILPGECAFGKNNNRLLVVPENETLLDLVCFNNCQACDKEPNIKVKFTSSVPVIDGIEDGLWSSVLPVPILKNYIGENPTIDAYWKAMWCDSGIFVLLNVQDDDHYPAWESGGNPWEYDWGQIYFDVNQDLFDGMGPANYASGHYDSYAFFREDEYDKFHDYYPETDFDESQTPRGQYAYHLEGESWVLERYYPFTTFVDKDWKYLDKNEFLLLGDIGFDIEITDQDEGITTVRQRKVWQSDGIIDEAWNNMDGCGTITLVEDTIDNYFINVTFRVNMQNEVVSEEGVYLNGSFGNWAGTVMMTKSTYSDIYYATLKLIKRDTIEYKFINGAAKDLSKYEILSGECAFGKNNSRLLVVSENETLLDAACFGTCQECVIDTNVNVNITTSAPAIDGIEEELWETVHPVKILKNYIGENPTVEAYWKALYDKRNFYVLINVIDQGNHYPGWESGGNNWEYDKPEVYWDFNEELKDGIGPGVKQSGHYQLADGFLEDSYDIAVTNYPFTDVNPGGTYAYSLTGENYVYEMVVPWKNFFDKEFTKITVNTAKSRPIGFDVYIVDQDEGITNSRQRKVWQNFGPISKEAWNNMDGCGTITLIGGEDINGDSTEVTFNVDMKDEVISSAGVTLNGSFCNWTGGIPMKNVNNGTVYSASIILKSGVSIEYKFVNGRTTSLSKYEIIKGVCSLSNDENRIMVVPEEDFVDLDIVCFGQCDDCESVIDDLVYITFRVDMNKETVSSDGVLLNGSFCNWVGGVPMNQIPGSTIYAATVKLKPADIVEYKFVNGRATNFTKYETIPITCSYGDDQNRMLIVPKNDDTLSAYYFGICEINTGVDQMKLNNIKLYPNPNDGKFTIEIERDEVNSEISVYDIIGTKIYISPTSDNEIREINLPKSNKGIYFVNISNKEGQIMKKIVVK